MQNDKKCIKIKLLLLTKIQTKTKIQLVAKTTFLIFI